MTLTFGLNSVRDLFAKLHRDAAALDDEVTSDRLFNFVLTGYSMIDWVKNDPAIPASAKASIGQLHGDTWLKVCGDLATAAKHFKLSSRVPITSATTRSQGGYGIARFEKAASELASKASRWNLTTAPNLAAFSWSREPSDAGKTFFPRTEFDTR